MLFHLTKQLKILKGIFQMFIRLLTELDIDTTLMSRVLNMKLQTAGFCSGEHKDYKHEDSLSRSISTCNKILFLDTSDMLA